LADAAFSTIIAVVYELSFAALDDLLDGL